MAYRHGPLKRIGVRLQGLASKARTAGHIQFRLLCWELITIFRRTLTCSSRQGVFTVPVGDDQSIGKSLYSTGQYELDLMTEAITLLRRMDRCPPKGQGTIVDVGANIGVISIGFLHRGEMATAVAIEPAPRNFSLLQHNVKQNKLEKRVVCLPYAVSDQPGELSFEVSDGNLGDYRVRSDVHRKAARVDEQYSESARDVIQVQGERLDALLATIPDFLARDIALIWVDVQGYEGYVFSGGRTILATGVPVISEIWPYGIRRSGMTDEEFCGIAESIWSSYWVMRRGGFVRYPIGVLNALFDELGPKGWDNVIFMK